MYMYIIVYIHIFLYIIVYIYDIFCVQYKIFAASQGSTSQGAGEHASLRGRARARQAIRQLAHAPALLPRGGRAPVRRRLGALLGA